MGVLFGAMLFPCEIPAGDAAAKTEADSWKAVQQALRRPVKVEFKNTPLKDALVELAKQLEIPLVFDEKQMEFSTIDPDKKITLCAKRSGRSVLISMLGDLGLHYRVQNGGISVPFEDQTDAGFDAWREDVSDLAALDSNLDFEQLIEDARAIVAPTTWDVAGGKGTVSFEHHGDKRAFAFKQSQEVREQLDEFFANYRKLCRVAFERNRFEGAKKAGKTAETESLPPAPFMSFDEPDPANAKINAVLESPNEFYFKETPLRRVAEVLSQRLQIPVEIDAKALAEMEMKDDLPITKRTPRLRARAALDILIEDISLVFTVKNEVLLLTSYSTSASNETTHYYEVTDLVRANDRGVEKQNCDALAALIRSQSAMEYMWNETDGTHAIVPLAVGDARFFAVTEVVDWQRSIRDLLVHLHAMQHPPRPTAERKTPASAFSSDSPYAERPFPKIRESLEKPIAFDFKELTLDKIAKKIERRSGIPVVVDWRSLDSENIDPSRAFSIDVKEMKLRDALDAMTAELNMTWGIYDDALTITTSENYFANTEKRIYDVHDLPAFRRPDGRPAPDFEQLKLAITQSIQEDSWEEMGGAGSIHEYDSGGIQILVVDQTYAVHERILLFLENMRKLRKWPLTAVEIEKLPPAPVPSEEAKTVRRYRPFRGCGMGMF
jgi:hypothetical protein